VSEYDQMYAKPSKISIDVDWSNWAFHFDHNKTLHENILDTARVVARDLVERPSLHVSFANSKDGDFLFTSGDVELVIHFPMKQVLTTLLYDIADEYDDTYGLEVLRRYQEILRSVVIEIDDLVYKLTEQNKPET